MATVKAYTDIEQSRKLAKILPIETSDMYWDLLLKDGYARVNNIGHCLCRTCVYAWSLAALLGVLPNNESKNTDLSKGRYDTQNKKYIDDWSVSYNEENGKNYFVTHADNPVDACVEMILNLHELKKLRL